MNYLSELLTDINNKMKNLILLLIVIISFSSCEKEVSSCEKEENESGLVVNTTQVVNGNAPVIWTELDISNAVGQNYAMVTLKIYNLSSSSGILAIFRQKGDIDDYIVGSDTDNMVSLGTNGIGQAIIYTDSNGIIEWKATTSVSVKIEVVAYIK